MTEDELKNLLGHIAFSEYSDCTESGKKKVLEALERVQGMSDKDFVEFASESIVASARALSRPENFENIYMFADIYAISSLCSAEARRRYTKAGHSEVCTGQNLYYQAHNRAMNSMRSEGYMPLPHLPCDCGRTESRKIAVQRDGTMFSVMFFDGSNLAEVEDFFGGSSVCSAVLEEGVGSSVLWVNRLDGRYVFPFVSGGWLLQQPGVQGARIVTEDDFRQNFTVFVEEDSH